MPDIKYDIQVTDMMVHEWGDEGQGKYVCSKGGFRLGIAPTLDKAREHIDAFFGYKIEDDCIDGQFIRGTLIEDAAGYQDDNGNYIVDYTVIVNRVETVQFNEGF